MADTPPGQTQRERHGFDGEWVTITRAEYNAILRPAGDLDLAVWTVAASATRPCGRNYVFTAWCRRDDESVMVASEMDSCDSQPDPATCPGTHTFLRFIPDRPHDPSTPSTTPEGQPC